MTLSQAKSIGAKQGSMYDVRRVATRGGPLLRDSKEPNNKCGYGTTSEGTVRWAGKQQGGAKAFAGRLEPPLTTVMQA